MKVVGSDERRVSYAIKSATRPAKYTDQSKREILTNQIAIFLDASFLNTGIFMHIPETGSCIRSVSDRYRSSCRLSGLYIRISGPHHVPTSSDDPPYAMKRPRSITALGRWIYWPFLVAAMDRESMHIYVSDFLRSFRTVCTTVLYCTDCCVVHRHSGNLLISAVIAGWI